MADISLRNSGLDGLRGLAALSVAICHSLIMMKAGGVDQILSTPINVLSSPESIGTKLLLTIFGNGPAAVDLFFVLSGLVLASSLDRNSSYYGFILKRIFRIFPAVAIAVIAAAGACLMLGGRPELDEASIWLNTQFITNPAPDIVFRNIVLYRPGMLSTLWTLRVEWLTAILFPALWMLMRKSAWYMDVLYMAVAVFLSALCEFTAPGHFTYMFMAGILLNKHAGRIIGVAELVPGGWILPISLLLLLTPGLDINDHLTGNDLLQALGSLLLIAYVMSRQAFKPGAFLTFAGEVSYSFYLVHPLVMVPLALLMINSGLPGLIGNVPTMLVTAAASIAMTLSIASLVYRWIELPGIGLGKNLLSRSR